MRDGTGRIFQSGIKNCLYGRRDGMFTGTGRFSLRVYMRMLLTGKISPGTIFKLSIITSLQSGMECSYDKNCPALAGIPVERTGIPLCWVGTKNVPAKFCPYKQIGTNIYIYIYIYSLRRRVHARNAKIRFLFCAFCLCSTLSLFHYLISTAEFNLHSISRILGKVY